MLCLATWMPGNMVMLALRGSAELLGHDRLLQHLQLLHVGAEGTMGQPTNVKGCEDHHPADAAHLHTCRVHLMYLMYRGVSSLMPGAVRPCKCHCIQLGCLDAQVICGW